MERSWPRLWNSRKPPSEPWFFTIPVLCGNWPLSSEARDGQQSESVTV
nr:hypothetical protein [Actinoplanes xinjiangensis]